MKMSTVYAGNAEITAFITGSLYSFNFLTRKIAIQLPFAAPPAVVPI
jgi:cellobiose-specific phosphotransferase system component IIC